MYLHKIPHPRNFEFADKIAFQTDLGIQGPKIQLHLDAYRQDIYRLGPRSSRWRKNLSLAALSPPPRRSDRDDSCQTQLQAVDGRLRLQGPDGQVLLESCPGEGFGVCKAATLYAFAADARTRYYGMGEKCLGLELSGVRTKFWNTDVWADFDSPRYTQGRPDPMYVSIPYLIVKRGNVYLGLLLDNPYPTFMTTARTTEVADQMKVETAGRNRFCLGSEDGRCDLYLLYGPSLAELTRKFQQLVGTTPLPPAWALGYQQCRWGYASFGDLDRLDRNFRKNRIPCDGLWLDIDYMDGYRVFRFSEDHWTDPPEQIARIRKRGRRVVAILDPGVKQEPGYEVYESGRRDGIFCRNEQGGEFVGIVWPGETVFPDFSLPEGRHWWARHVEQFAAKGIDAAWLDMNDPSTGYVDDEQMRFGRGREPHAAHHNQYALGMAMASRAGFQAARPDRRPFLLTRSASTGIARHAAVWTGDNVSNYHHLRTNLVTSMNLALSGVPFNGMDLGGFGGDADPQLMVDWHKAAFLLPFCRNHCVRGRRNQEPWAFDATTTKVLREYIVERYQLRPYLYNLFIRQELRGEAILRPLLYDFADTEQMPLDRVDDQYMIGPQIMQAPLLQPNQATRTVLLPGDRRWYDAMAGKWRKPGRKLRVVARAMQTPLFVRQGAILPTSRTPPADNRWQPRQVDLHIFLPSRGPARACYDYYADDGETLDYQQGRRSCLHVEAEITGQSLEIRTELTEDGFGPIDARFILPRPCRKMRINGRGVQGRDGHWTLAGTRQKVCILEA
jgi:alpha-glucosidase